VTSRSNRHAHRRRCALLVGALLRSAFLALAGLAAAFPATLPLEAQGDSAATPVADSAAASAADSTRPHYRVTMGIGDDHWLRFGFERDIRPGWAVKGLVGAGLVTGLAAIGPAVRTPTGKRSELGVFVGGGKMSCEAYFDAANLCPPQNGDVGWGLGGGAYWLFRLREDSQWSFGPELAYWNRPASGDGEGFDIWTMGIIVHKRFLGR